MKLTRARLEALVDDLIQRTKPPCQQAMKDAAVSASDIDEVVLVGGQTRMPKVQELVKQLFGKDAHKGVNPDEVVAVGAAIQAGVLSGDVKDVVLLDVTPLSLGVETQGGAMTVLIPRNTTIPTKKSEIFTTAADDQTAVDVHVLQGERPLARDNRTLGRFRLEGIPPAPRGMPQIEVTFDIDANGILNVSAKDTASGKQQQITITASSGLSKQDVERMVREAEANASEDARRRQEIEVRNQTDTLVYTTERALREHGGRVSEGDRRAVEVALNDAREAVKSDDIERMRRAQESLSRASQSLAQAASRGPRTETGEGGRPPGAPQEGDVIDAEFTDADERKAS
jgi:molecular chaperone DnaK